MHAYADTDPRYVRPHPWGRPVEGTQLRARRIGGLVHVRAFGINNVYRVATLECAARVRTNGLLAKILRAVSE